MFWDDNADQEQELAVFEINSGDRGSPVLLRLCPTPDAPLPTLGDLVPYTNKVCLIMLQHSLSFQCSNFMGMDSHDVLCV